MSTLAELEPRSSVPEGVMEIPEVPEIPKPLQEEVKVVPSQVTAQVTDDSGNHLMQTPATQQITITLPTDPASLLDWSKGSPVSALTWFAIFWIRMIKKATHLGWKIVTKGGSA